MDVHNIYNQVQVKLLMRPDELHDVPQFDEVFSDDDVSQFIRYICHFGQILFLIINDNYPGGFEYFPFVKLIIYS